MSEATDACKNTERGYMDNDPIFHRTLTDTLLHNKTVLVQTLRVEW